MGLGNFIFKLLRTKKVSQYKNEYPSFQLYFPTGWRQLKTNQPIAFYHEKSNSGLTIYLYQFTEQTKKVYSEMMRDDYGIQMNETNLESEFSNSDSIIKLNINTEEDFQLRSLRLIKNDNLLIDLCISGHPKNKLRDTELFNKWENEIKLCR